MSTGIGSKLVNISIYKLIYKMWILSFVVTVHTCYRYISFDNLSSLVFLQKNHLINGTVGNFLDGKCLVHLSFH